MPDKSPPAPSGKSQYIPAAGRSFPGTAQNTYSPLFLNSVIGPRFAICVISLRPTLAYLALPAIYETISIRIIYLNICVEQGEAEDFFY